MDETTSDIFNTVNEPALTDDDTYSSSRDKSSEKEDGKHQGKGGWRGLSALKAQASMQDKLLEKLLQQVMPAADIDPGGAAQDHPIPADSFPKSESARPPFTPATMATNFTRFNARIGVVFKFQVRAARVFAWRQPSHTLSFLAVYTLVCLDPYLLCVLPLAVALVGIFIPSFMARHPSDAREFAYHPHGPPRAPPHTIRPAKQMSSHFLKNMRDLQNSMEDFSRVHDQIVTGLVPKTNFSDEALSSALFIALFLLTLFMTIAAHLLPWRAIALGGGWAAVVSAHPSVEKMLQETQATYFPETATTASSKKDADGVDKEKEKEAEAKIQAPSSFLDEWIARDIILDSAPETREVEIFELQHLGTGSGEWEPWVFSPSPYDPLSQARITGDRPRGTRFFEDVRAPEGWEWSEKKWALDLWSREWVEERIITGVEVETEGERWVYDMYSESDVLSGVREEKEDHDDEAGGLAAAAADAKKKKRSNLSWTEGEEGEGRRGEWRRRRWVRLVKRKAARNE